MIPLSEYNHRKWSNKYFAYPLRNFRRIMHTIHLKNPISSINTHFHGIISITHVTEALHIHYEAGVWDSRGLRSFQCLFAIASIVVMASSSGFTSVTSFCYLIAAMFLQVLWSVALACLDILALRLKKDLQTRIFLTLVVIGDWVTALSALAASSSSAAVVVFLLNDSEHCNSDPLLSCTMFQISIALAFVAWFLIAISSHTVLWLLASPS